MTMTMEPIILPLVHARGVIMTDNEQSITLKLHC